MPRDLPGFYWDALRNRYFPITSNQLLQNAQRSPLAPPTATNPNYPLSSLSRGCARPCRSIWRLTDLARSHHQRALQLRHDLFGLHIAHTSCVTEPHIPIFGEIRKFISSTNETGQTYRLLGDSQGWIYTPRTSDDAFWSIDSNLDSESEISSLNICDTYSLATSFGPNSKIRVQKLDDPNFSFIITAKDCHDIRCSNYTIPNQVVVGAKQHAVHLTDIFNQPRTRILKTYSDVFSVTHHQDQVYAGTRNGSIHRFDLRIPSSRNNKNVFISRDTRSTVLHMQLLNDIQFLTSYMNGELLIYDIRYTRPNTPTPILQFPNHINTHTPRLGITTDSTSQFLFAAGQDHKIRGWSIRTGDPLLIPPTPLTPRNQKNPLLMSFEHPVETLQITRERQPPHDSGEYNVEDRMDMDNIGAGMCLWAGSGQRMYRFDLGCCYSS